MTIQLTSTQVKICRKCKNSKDVLEFCKDRSRKDGYSNKCRICMKIDDFERNSSIQGKLYKKEYNLMYYSDETIKGDVKIYQEEYRFKNKEILKNRHKTYCSRQDIKERKNQQFRERYKNDIQYRLRIILGSYIYQCLKDQNLKKSLKSNSLLGCTIEFYKQHLEDQFLPEMNWENHGSVWEIDHITPVSSFDLVKKEEQEKCFHYINTQPLFKTTEIAESFGYKDYVGNREKSNK